MIAAVADNSAANAQLLEWIERVNGLPAALTTEAAPEIAEVCKEIIGGNIRAGRSPDGQAWELTAEGKRPLRFAEKALSSHAFGTRVVMMLKGPEALHHKGQVSGGIRRQILPTRRVPQSMTEAIRLVLGERFSDHMGGG